MRQNIPRLLFVVMALCVLSACSSEYQHLSIRHPRWSHGDGLTVVFYSDANGNADIVYTNIHGTLLNSAASTSFNEYNPAFSEDGELIAFSSNRELNTDSTDNYDIYVSDKFYSGLKRLTTNSAVDTDPDFSPDGREIVFTSTRDGDQEIFIVGIDGSNLRQITRNSSADRMAVWSPDGRRLAFVSNRAGSYQIFVMNYDGTDQRQITDNDGDNYNPDWSPDGKHIVFHSTKDGPNDGQRYADYLGDTTREREKFLQNHEIYLMKSDGSDLRRITRNSEYDGQPSFGPDGRFLWSAKRDSADVLIFADPDGTVYQQFDLKF